MLLCVNFLFRAMQQASPWFAENIRISISPCFKPSECAFHIVFVSLVCCQPEDEIMHPIRAVGVLLGDGTIADCVVLVCHLSDASDADCLQLSLGMETHKMLIL